MGTAPLPSRVPALLPAQVLQLPQCPDVAFKSFFSVLFDVLPFPQSKIRRIVAQNEDSYPSERPATVLAGVASQKTISKQSYNSGGVYA